MRAARPAWSTSRTRKSPFARPRPSARYGPEPTGAIRDGSVAKGDVLATARIAGIMAAKRTPDLIPMCHPIAVHGVEVDVVPDPSQDVVRVRVVVRTADRTGVEMEALTAVSVACLTIVDMTKARRPGRDDRRHIRGVQDRREERGLAPMRARVIVCSDSAAAGTTADTTGPVLVAGLQALGCEVGPPVIVADEIGAIVAAIRNAHADVVVCTGGTGLGPARRDPRRGPAGHRPGTAWLRRGVPGTRAPAHPLGRSLTRRGGLGRFHSGRRVARQPRCGPRRPERARTPA